MLSPAAVLPKETARVLEAVAPAQHPSLLLQDQSAARKQDAATGTLKYECVQGKTAATYVYATYPLKFLHPRRTVRQGFDTFITVREGVGKGGCIYWVARTRSSSSACMQLFVN